VLEKVGMCAEQRVTLRGIGVLLYAPERCAQDLDTAATEGNRD
jgi:hypothetical protein